MSVNKTLWVAEIPYRKYAYGGLYLGILLAILAMILLPSHSALPSIGIGLILFSTFYLAERLYKAGFRRQSVQLSLLLLLLTGVTITCTKLYHATVFG